MRDAAHYYNEQLLKIIGYGIVVIIPMWLILSNYNQLLMIADWGGSENILLLFMNIFMFIIFVRPLFFLYKRISIGEEMEFKELLKDFLWSVGPVTCIGLCIFGVVYVGLSLFIVPGLSILPLVFILPFVYDPSITLKVMIKELFRFYCVHFVQIWIQVVLWVSLLTLVWSGVLYITSFLEMSSIAYDSTRLVFSIIMYPFITFYISEKFMGLRKGEVY